VAQQREVDFYDLKGDLEALLSITGRAADFTFTAHSHDVLHPGQVALIADSGQPAGVLGRLHPFIENDLGLDQAVYLFEIRLDSLVKAKVPEFREFSRFPIVQRDIALLIASNMPSSDVIESIKRHAGDLLINLELFDQYQGEHVDSGKKSLALTLTLQHSSRTLTDTEIESLMESVIQGVQADLDAKLR
jgi:phenylalanyl-tRNA synthetase beta chain